MPNRRTLALTALAALGAGTLAWTPAVAQPADAAAVEQAVEALRSLMLAPDRAKLEAMFADALSYGHSDGRVQTKAEFIDALVNKTSLFHSITLSNQKVSVVGDIAIVRHRFEADVVSNGTPGHPRINILQAWQKQGGTWRLLVRQAH